MIYQNELHFLMHIHMYVFVYIAIELHKLCKYHDIIRMNKLTHYRVLWFPFIFYGLLVEVFVEIGRIVMWIGADWILRNSLVDGRKDGI